MRYRDERISIPSRSERVILRRSLRDIDVPLLVEIDIAVAKAYTARTGQVTERDLNVRERLVSGPLDDKLKCNGLITRGAQRNGFRRAGPNYVGGRKVAGRRVAKQQIVLLEDAAAERIYSIAVADGPNLHARRCREYRSHQSKHRQRSGHKTSGERACETSTKETHDVPGLPEQLQSKLNHPAALSRPYLPKAIGVYVRVRQIKIHLVEDVKRLSAELQFQPLDKREILQDRHIGVVKRRTADQTAPGVAVGARRHLTGWDESLCVEELSYLCRATRMTDLDLTGSHSRDQLSVLTSAGPVQGDIFPHVEGNRRAALELCESQ